MQIVQADRVPFAQGTELSGAVYLSPAGCFMVVDGSVTAYLAYILYAVHSDGTGTDCFEVFIVERQQEVFTRHIVVGNVGENAVVDIGVSCRKGFVECFRIIGHIHF